MRDRHSPRLCDSCGAPMARQEAACWSCGTQWAAEEVPRTALRVIAGGAGRDRPEPQLAAAVAAAGAVTLNHIDANRWIIDGGSFDSDVAAQIRLTTARK
jgi:hypothetical protein